MKTPERILIARTDRLGDVILSTPAIKALRLSFPESHIAFLCRPYTREVLEDNPYLDEVMAYDKYGRHKGWIATILFALALRKKRFDLALLLHPTSRVHIISFIAGIPVRVGWDWPGKCSFLLTRKIPHNKHLGQKHESEYTLDLVRSLGIEANDLSLYFPLKQAAVDRINDLLARQGLSAGDSLIVIHPSASCPSRRWPAAHFSELINRLKVRRSIRIAIVCAEEEKPFTEQIIKDHPDLIDLRGKLDISGLGALISRARLFIANDSGPAHIAASLNIPVISLFSRKNPGLSPLRWRPLGVHSFYIHKDAGCSKCKAHNCDKGFLCLEAISPDEVADLALQVIEARLSYPDKS